MKALVRFAMTVMTIAILAILVTMSPVIRPAIADNLTDTNFYTQDTSKIDLNNANINAFRKIRGFYPSLGRVLIQNAPYSSLDDVLKISGLTDAQKQLIQSNVDKFTLKKPNEAMDRERINNSIYRL